MNEIELIIGENGTPQNGGALHIGTMSSDEVALALNTVTVELATRGITLGWKFRQGTFNCESSSWSGSYFELTLSRPDDESWESGKESLELIASRVSETLGVQVSISPPVVRTSC